MIMKAQREIASRVLGCGKSRIWLDPSKIKDIEEAITADDIRRLIKDGLIRTVPKKGNSGYRIGKNRLQKSKGRRKGKGSRKGKIGTRAQRKKLWIKRIRALRKTLKELAEQKKIGKAAYRTLYKMSKSGFFRSRAHLMLHAEKEGMLKQQKSK